jgi:putative ABC transport system substrate-binding protein
MDVLQDETSALRKGLLEQGYMEGRNVAFQHRSAEDRLDRLPALANDLVDQRVAVIFAASTAAPVLAAKAATSSIPIVFSMGADPVGIGAVASLSKPGGNVTVLPFSRAN